MSAVINPSRRHVIREACGRLAARTGDRKAPVFYFHELPRVEPMKTQFKSKKCVEGHSSGVGLKRLAVHCGRRL